MYRYEYVEREGLSARMLCKQGVLRHLARADGTTSATVREVAF